MSLNGDVPKERKSPHRPEKRASERKKNAARCDADWSDRITDKYPEAELMSNDVPWQPTLRGGIVTFRRKNDLLKIAARRPAPSIADVPPVVSGGVSGGRILG